MKKQNKQPQHEPQLSRRHFLAGVASAAPAAAVVAAVPGAASAAPQEAVDGKSQSKGYRLTAHILAYYKSAAR